MTARAPNLITGLYAWHEADALALADLAAVGTWSDSSGAGRSLTQGTGSKQPIFRTNIINSLPVVRFDATQFHALRSATHDRGSTGWAVFVTDFTANVNGLLLDGQNFSYLTIVKG